VKGFVPCTFVAIAIAPKETHGIFLPSLSLSLSLFHSTPGTFFLTKRLFVLSLSLTQSKFQKYNFNCVLSSKARTKNTREHNLQRGK
jgi:hypothetical protein